MCIFYACTGGVQQYILFSFLCNGSFGPPSPRWSPLNFCGSSILYYSIVHIFCSGILIIRSDIYSSRRQFYSTILYARLLRIVFKSSSGLLLVKETSQFGLFCVSLILLYLLFYFYTYIYILFTALYYSRKRSIQAVISHFQNLSEGFTSFLITTGILLAAVLNIMQLPPVFPTSLEKIDILLV